MRSIVTVTVPATNEALTTLDRVKLELDIENDDSDEVLQAKIDEASSDIEASLGYRLVRETVSEAIYRDLFDHFPMSLLLERYPIVSITSVTVDGEALSASLYRLDPKTSELIVLDSSGYPCGWFFQQSVVVVYVAGYILPGESGENLPEGIQGAAVELISNYWAARGRDPSVKSENIPGLMAVDYWVGAVGEAGELPPSVVSKLAAFRWGNNG